MTVPVTIVEFPGIIPVEFGIDTRPKGIELESVNEKLTSEAFPVYVRLKEKSKEPASSSILEGKLIGVISKTPLCVALTKPKLRTRTAMVKNVANVLLFFMCNFRITTLYKLFYIFWIIMSIFKKVLNISISPKEYGKI